MKLHIIGVPRNPSTPNIAMDPYAMVSYYLTTYLHRAGHEVHYYGFEESTVECTSKWVCANLEDHHKNNIINFEKNHWQQNHRWETEYSLRALEFLKKNVKDNEIILCLWSTTVSCIKEPLDSLYNNLKIVDGHIGHRSPSLHTPFHVFASYANRHVVYGMNNNREELSYWHDTVIYPMANELSNFTFKKEKKDYFLFMSRLNEDKGLGVFFDLASHFPNEKFILAGQGVHMRDVPDNVEEVGLLDPSERKKYLADAKAVISPSHYPEPFGLTSIEAQLSGTPIICTDWGGFTESVIEGVTGFRCSYFNDFVNAVKNVSMIDPNECRKNGEKYVAESLIKDWEKYLHRIDRLHWYSLDEK